MALTEAEELELLELEELEAKAAGMASAPTSAPTNTSPFPVDQGKKGYSSFAEMRSAGPHSPLDALKSFTSEMQNTGTKMAEAVGTKLSGTPLQGVAPYIGAGIGTTVAMAPDIISGAVGNVPAVKGLGLAPKLAKEAPSKVAKLAASGVEKVTGIEAEATLNLFKKPLELFLAPTKKQVNNAYAKSELKKAVKTIVDKAEEGTMTDGAYINRAKRTLVKRSPLVKEQAGDMLLKGRQALDAQIDSLKAKLTLNPKATAIRNKVKAKQEFREEINLALDQIAPQHRAADALAARQFAVDPFRQLTLPGKVAFTSPEGLLRAVPGLPSAVGLGLSAAGALGKGVSNLPRAGLMSTPFMLENTRK